MDYQKKKLLTQSVSYMQANLVLTTEMLTSLKSREVLTSEEVSTIQKDEILSGKVLELVCLLKRKDNRTYNKFINCMEELNFPAIAKMLKLKTETIAADADPRTIHFIEVQLGKKSVDPRIIKDMAGNLVLKEIHVDEINSLQDRMAALQRQLKTTSQLLHQAQTSPDGSRMATPLPGPSDTKQGPLPTDPLRPKTPGSDRATPKWDVPTQLEEMQLISKQKDDIMKKKDDEYCKLRTILEDTQNDLQSVLDLNGQYLNIIGQLNQMQIAANNTPRMRDKSDQDLAYEQKMEESENLIKQLRGELGGIQENLESKEKDLQIMANRENKYKSMLGLGKDASTEDVERRIQEIIMDGTMNRHEIEKIKKEMNKIVGNKAVLEEKVTALGREKEKVEFHMRQQDLAIKKMNRLKTSSGVLSSAQKMLGEGALNYVKLPSVDQPSVQFRISSAMTHRTTGSYQYCMFCRQEFQPVKSKGCRCHFRPIRNGKWACCKDDCHRGAGCLQVPHFYVEITADKKILLTDGARYMDIG